MSKLAADDLAKWRRSRHSDTLLLFDRIRDDAEYAAAEQRWEQGDADGCIERLQRLLHRNPDHVEARLLLAEVLLTKDRPQEAHRCLQAAVETHPDDPRVYYTLALTLEKLGLSDQAHAAYRRASELTSSGRTARQGKQRSVASKPAASGNSPAARGGHARLLRVHSRLRQPQLADLLGRPDRYDRSNRNERADSLDSSGRTARKAEAVAPASYVADEPDQPPASEAAAGKPLVEMFPASCEQWTAEQWFDHGVESLEKQSPAVALRCFWQAMQKKPDDPQIPLRAAVAALRQNRPEVAAEVARAAVELFPDSAALYRALGTAYYRQGDYESSQAALEQALALDNTSALTYFLLGCALEKLGRAEEAAACFDEAGALDPRYNSAR